MLELLQPVDRESRAAKRKAIRDHRIAQAEANAARIDRSIKCGEYGQHADQEGGCANDGSTCLCECHDPKESGKTRARGNGQEG